MEGILGQIAIMLETFSGNDPGSVTDEAIHYPEVADTESALMRHHHIHSLDIQKDMGIEDLNHVWQQWKRENETFEDFLNRVRTWSHEINPQTVYLVDPKDPKYSFPQFVSYHALNCGRYMLTWIFFAVTCS